MHLALLLLLLLLLASPRVFVHLLSVERPVSHTESSTYVPKAPDEGSVYHQVHNVLILHFDSGSRIPEPYLGVIVSLVASRLRAAPGEMLVAVYRLVEIKPTPMRRHIGGAQWDKMDKSHVHWLLLLPVRFTLFLNCEQRPRDILSLAITHIYITRGPHLTTGQKYKTAEAAREAEKPYQCFRELQAITITSITMHSVLSSLLSFLALDAASTPSVKAIHFSTITVTTGFVPAPTGSVTAILFNTITVTSTPAPTVMVS
ncbi:hypothetical protein M406DRAFT_329988 [Cryphonectria parasitica EP155]|uniref:Secreted protein n=1 Tax=Cryphonectria parasitica (strain ATCC 38755 / EP155) TaxID=660469 RepID=A0A9P4Y381_CRYP1|nr:uncharacterized protein M406DRAFT_329988 [Cryphonectria parasitica EP155]KAF3766147.1 hypothetical protein M406DRAFT_329988 [Cryphonectria parasitica EP155]